MQPDARFRPLPLVLLTQAAFLFLLAASAAQEQAPEPPQVTFLDGKTVAAANLQVAAGVLAGTDIPKGTTIDDLQQIQVTAAPILPPTEKPAIIVDLIGGGSVGAMQVTIADDQCTITRGEDDSLKVPIDALRAIRLQPTIDSEEFNKSLAAPAADVDRIFVKVEGKIDSITGLVNKLTETEIAIELDGQVRNLPRDRVLGIVISLAAPETRLPRCTFHLTDGSVLGGDLISLQGNKAQIQIAGNSQVALPWDSVQRVSVRSSRVLHLSDLKPSSVKEQTIATKVFPWQRDKSVTRKPLTLGTRTFDKGLGVHSHSEMTFDVPDDFDVLTATIGIDADAAGKGDCQFEVLVDGQRVFSERVRGSDPPRDLQIPLQRSVSGGGLRGKQITLVVLPGADLDFADHADWADIRLLKNKK